MAERRLGPIRKERQLHSLWFQIRARCSGDVTLWLARCGRPVHTSRMDRRFEEQLRIENKLWRRRTFVILAGFVAFLASLYFTSDPDDTLTLAIGLVFYYITVLLIPDSWFGPGRPKLTTDGPRPALRSQPPPPPSRERPLEWPPREGPLPPLPERPRRR